VELFVTRVGHVLAGRVYIFSACASLWGSSIRWYVIYDGAYTGNRADRSFTWLLDGAFGIQISFVCSARSPGVRDIKTVSPHWSPGWRLSGAFLRSAESLVEQRSRTADPGYLGTEMKGFNYSVIPGN